ncbi:MAG TPA: hypothetical protein VH682_10605 [Gemmataceae bacterium]|jgi:hypothetical protein
MSWLKTTRVLAVLFAGTLLVTTALAQRATVPSAAPPPSGIAVAVTLEARPEPESPKKESKAESPRDAVLHKWAKADEGVREEHFQFTRTEKDNTWDTRTVTKGEVYVKKPDLWCVELRDKDGKMERIWLLESKRLHNFDFAAKTERVFPFSIDVVPVGDTGGLRLSESFLGISLKGWETQFRWSMIGVQARDFSTHFEVRLTKENQWYSYLDITPRSREGKSWFHRARVVLNRDGYRVRQLWMESANGNEVVTDYSSRRTNPDPPITRESLLMKLPNGWKRIFPPGEKDADK